MKTKNPFLTSEFVDLWHKRKNGEKSEVSFTLFNDSCWAIPLLFQNRLGLRVCQTFGRGFVDYFDISDLDASSIHSFSKNHSEYKWDLMILHNVVSSSSTNQLIQTVTMKDNLQIQDFFVSRAPFLKIDQNWDMFYETKKKKFRYNLNRAERKLNEIGDLKLVHHTTPDQIAQNLDLAFDIHWKRWQGRYNSSRFSHPAWKAFYRELAIAFAEKGWMDLVLLEVGGKSIAFSYGFIFNNKYYFYVTAIDPDTAYEKYSPGTVLIRHLLEKAFESGLDEFDFMLGDEAYKRIWTKSYREVYTYALTRNALKAKLIFFIYAGGLGIKQKIRQSKTLPHLAQRILLHFK